MGDRRVGRGRVGDPPKHARMVVFLFDTHNEFRFAVAALSGKLLLTIYAKRRESVRE
jgi:hypothetical protein